jgi:PKHD-type hydroxylase
MRRNIIIAKKALSADLCNTIIERAKPSFEKGYTGTPDKTNSIRQSQVSWLNGTIKHLDIYTPVSQLIHKVNSEFYNFDLMDPEPFQITKYDESNQGFYKPHEDGVYDMVPENQYVRKLSVSIQLTSPEHYQGGTFQFPDDVDSFNVEDSLEQGTAIFFPSYIKHGVVPVTKGTRYSLVCWVAGPNFR